MTVQRLIIEIDTGANSANITELLLKNGAQELKSFARSLGNIYVKEALGDDEMPLLGVSFHDCNASPDGKHCELCDYFKQYTHAPISGLRQYRNIVFDISDQ